MICLIAMIDIILIILFHKLFTDDDTFIELDKNLSCHSAIQQAMLTMAMTTHRLIILQHRHYKFKNEIFWKNIKA